MKPILVFKLEDKRLINDLERASYRQVGMAVKSFANYDEIVRALGDSSRPQPDVVVVDVDSFEETAIAICEGLVYHLKGKETPVIVTSVQSGHAKQNLLLETGVDLFVEQPIPKSVFVEKIKKLLDHFTRETARVEMSQKIQAKIEDLSLHVELKDLSISGVLLESREILELGKRIEGRFSLDGKNCEFKGELVREIHSGNPHAKLYGVKFEDLSDSSQNQISRYVIENSAENKNFIYYL